MKRYFEEKDLKGCKRKKEFSGEESIHPGNRRILVPVIYSFLLAKVFASGEPGRDSVLKQHLIFSDPDKSTA